MLLTVAGDNDSFKASKDPVPAIHGSLCKNRFCGKTVNCGICSSNDRYVPIRPGLDKFQLLRYLYDF